MHEVKFEGGIVAQLTKICRPVGCRPVGLSPGWLSPSWFVAQLTGDPLQLRDKIKRFFIIFTLCHSTRLTIRLRRKRTVWFIISAKWTEWNCQTGGYTVFSFVCLCVCLWALSPVFNSVHHLADICTLWAPFCYRCSLFTSRLNVVK